MIKYIVKPEYWDLWGVSSKEAATVDLTEIERLSCEWGKGVNDLMNQVDESITPAEISIDNGINYCTPEEALERIDWGVIVSMMDDETREAVHNELAPCTKIEFLTRYIEIAPGDLIIG